MKLPMHSFWVLLFFMVANLCQAIEGTPPSENATETASNALNTESSQKQREYHIGPLDLIDIKVLYSDEISRVVRVDSKGNISLPMIGLIKAAGFTTFELEQLITNKLSVDLIQNPQVTVFIKEFTSQRMTVQGVVNRAGVYDFQGQATLLQAISMAGGLSEKADETAVKVIRKSPGKNEETITYDINLIRANKIDDPLLENGDVVMAEEKKPISVQGAVRSAGIYYLRGNASLMQVLAQSGGITDAADSSEVSIASKMPDGSTVTVLYDIEKIKTNKIKDPEVVPGDQVIVGASFIKGLVTGVTSTLRGFIMPAPVGR